MVDAMTLHLQKLSLHSRPKPNPEDFHDKPELFDLFNALAAGGVIPHDDNKDLPSFVGGNPGWSFVNLGDDIKLDWSLIPFGMLVTHVGDPDNEDNFHCVAVRYNAGKYFIICGALEAQIMKASPEAFQWCLNDNRGQECLRHLLNKPFEHDRVE